MLGNRTVKTVTNKQTGIQRSNEQEAERIRKEKTVYMVYTGFNKSNIALFSRREVAEQELKARIEEDSREQHAIQNVKIDDWNNSTF